MKKYAFGIDIGGTAIKLGLFQTDGTLLEKWQLPTRTEEQGAYVLLDALGSIRAVMARRSILWEDVEGIGMGVPGPVNDEGTVFRCVNLGWDVFSVPEKMRELEPCLHRVKVSNDVNAAALGELWKGGARGYHSAFLVTLGTGIGGGLVLNDRIVNGANGGAGEIGHFCVDPSEPERCSCGGHGCLEQYASARGLLRCARKAMPNAPKNMSAKTVCDMAREGDPVALSLLDQLGHMLGWTLTAVAGSVDPEVFVIGGGLSHAGSILLDRIQSEYRIFAFHAFRDTRFVLAELGNDAGIYGCVRMLLQEE